MMKKKVGSYNRTLLTIVFLAVSWLHLYWMVHLEQTAQFYHLITQH